MTVLIERLSHSQAKVKSRIVEGDDGAKNMFMEGIFVQGNVKNANQRVYPLTKLLTQWSQYKRKLTKVFLY